MPKEWTGNLIGRMHNHEITTYDLAQEMGVRQGYVSMLLNSKREPPGIQERMEKAVEAIIIRRKEHLNGAENHA